MRAIVTALLLATSVAAQGYWTRPVSFEGGKTVELDQRKAVLTLAADAIDRVRWSNEPEDPLYRSYAQANVKQVSVAMLESISKRFHDRLLATLELAVDKDRRIPLLAKLQAKVEARSATPWRVANLHLSSALYLAEPENSQWRDRMGVAAEVEAFLADATRSKPLGFYTWTPALERSFRCERYLQPALPLAGEGAWLAFVGKLLEEDAALRSDYAWLLRYAAVTTNPSHIASLFDTNKPEVATAAFFPASATREGDLFERLFGNRPIPEGTEFMQVFLNAVRDGSLRLQPRPDSGHYDLQLFALEPLVRKEAAREAAKVLRTATYQKLCDLTLKAVMTQRRETHVKRSDLVAVGAEAAPRVEIRVAPALTIEPQITWLTRTADSYGWLTERLSELLGNETLGKLRLVDEDGTEGGPVLSALREMEETLRALAALACHEVGGDPAWIGKGVDEQRALELVKQARTRLASKEWQADLAYDPRVIVPVARNVENGKLRCWATIGVHVHDVSAWYSTLPTLPAGANLQVLTGVQQVRIAAPVFLEVELRTPLTRREFRALCDEHKTVAAITAALAKR